jgi:rod shape determining protein RodA
MVFFSNIRRYFRYFDWVNFGIMMLLALCGLVFIFSASYSPEQPYSIFFKKQLIGIMLGLFIYMGCCCIDYRLMCQWGFYAYFLVLGLLIITIIKGSTAMGGQRWLNLFFFKVQPSELVKLFFPMFFSYFLIVENEQSPPLKTVIITFVMLVISAILVRKQPDLATALIIMLCGLLLFWLSNVSSKFFITLGALLLVVFPLAWHTMKPYQKKRISVFLGQGEIHNERYQLEQSKIAIGSGGLQGKGFLCGTQNKLHFLPEGRTDFIFAVICEEVGFVGALIIILLFCFLFARLLWLVSTLKYQHAYTLALGLLLPCIVSTIINIAMVLGLTPIAGIPLPLISYGLCNLWITMASLGILNSISIRRYYH